MNAVVSVAWLKKHFNDKNLILLDASLPKPVQGELSPYQDKTIPRARFFDLKGKFSDKESKFPNTLPSAQQFEEEAQKLGIKQNSQLVIFDNIGIYSSPRVWWMFKVMGHENVAVLDGGLPEWLAQGGELVDRFSQTYELGDFKAAFQSAWVKNYEEVLKNVDEHSFTIVDARSQGRFNGSAADPRKHLQSGAIPNSINIPYQLLLKEGKFKTKEEIKAIFEEKCKGDEQLVFSCGSGLTACIVMLGSEIAYKESRYLFDGSWTEWAERQGLTI